MRAWLLAIALSIVSSWIHADEYKAYWRCNDGHLEALEPHVKWNGLETFLYIHYMPAGQTTLEAVALNLKSLVNLPAGTQNGDLVMLGSQKQWLLNCVGEVHHNPVYHHGNLIFNVGRNAYSCPFIPKECRVSKQ